MTESQIASERIQNNNAHILLQARLLTGGEYLNPENILLAPPTKDDLGNKEIMVTTNSILQSRSVDERNAYWQKKASENSAFSGLDGQYKNWKDEMTLLLKNDNNKSMIDELTRIKIFTGKNIGPDIDSFYQRYFGKGVENGVEIFIDDIIRAYGYDLKSIQSNETAITWIASVFGGNAKIVITQLTEALSRIQSDKGKTELTAEVKEIWQSPLPPEDIRVLAWLYGNSNSTEITDEPVSEPESDREKPVSVEVMFSKLKKPIDKTNQKLMNEWFVETVPDSLVLSSNQIADIIAEPEPFLDSSGMTNKKQNPQVWDFMNEEDGQLDPRFYEAAWDLTDDDSSMLAISAISAETSKDQARLYGNIAGMLLQVNESDPRLILKYMKAQDQNSFAVFINDDLKRKQKGESDDYMLVPGIENGGLNESNFLQIWSARLKELRQAVDYNEFTMYHHRWIEALSRTVDIKKLFALLRGNK